MTYPITVRPADCFGYTTAGDVITMALKSILVAAPDAPLEADEYADTLQALNNYMAALSSDGIKLGYSRVCNIADIVTIPDGAVRGVAANLALEMAPQFGGKVSAALVKQAQDGLKTLYRMGVKVGESRYPVNLPGGAGNYCDYGRYYTGNKAPFAQMSMAANRKATVINDAAGAEKAQGTWSVGKFSGLTPDISGRVENKGDKYTATIKAELTLVADASITAGIAFTRNAHIAVYESAALSTTPTTVNIESTIELETGEFIDLVLADISTTENITLTDATVVLS